MSDFKVEDLDRRARKRIFTFITAHQLASDTNNYSKMKHKREQLYSMAKILATRPEAERQLRNEIRKELEAIEYELNPKSED